MKLHQKSLLIVNTSVLICIAALYTVTVAFINLESNSLNRFRASVFLLVILGIGIAFGILILIFLERLVFSRLAELNRFINQLGEPGDLSRRLLIDGNDELATLATSINNLLQTLDIAQAHNQEQGRALSDYGGALYGSDHSSYS
ncbi:MAG: HAMP domain-containing protein [Oscillatoriales cyanobacterium RM1_1_9]|nr:HAMP domain-containing protein [Oscillatoriales cyanobacterium RM1_1_9]